MASSEPSSSSDATAATATNPSEDLYKILDVAEKATSIELKAAYRRLSQRFHPDKHVDPAAKADATDQFTRVKEAFEILSNDKLRRLYHEFGLEAARSAAMPELELVPYADLAERFRSDRWSNRPSGSPGGPSDSPRDAYFTVSNSLEPRIDATGLVIALEDGLSSVASSTSHTPYDWSDPLAAISQVSLASHATAYVTQKDTLSVRYSLSGHGGGVGSGGIGSGLGNSLRDDAGVGEAVLSWRRQIDPHMHVEASAQAPLAEGQPSSIALKAFRTLSDVVSMSCEATYDPDRHEVTTGLSAARSLSDRTSASVSWAVGGRSGFAFTWTRHAYDEFMAEAKGRDPLGDNDDDGDYIKREDGLFQWLAQKWYRLLQPCGLRWTARFSSMDASLGVVARRPLGENAPLWEKCEPGDQAGAHVKVSALVGVMGWETKVAVSRRFMMSDSEAGTSLGIGTMGVIWRLRLRRGTHRLSIPIVLQSGFVDAKTATVAAVAASLSVALVESFVLQPWYDWQDRIDRAEAKERRAEVLQQGKAEAEEAVSLMSMQVERCRKAEGDVVVDGKSGGGLLIERAVYGLRRNVKKMRCSDASVAGREIEVEMAEVSVAVQALVHEGVVQLVSVTKTTLVGFWDPSAYGDKDELALRIWYLFRGDRHECLLRDDEPIEIPLSIHRVSNWT